MLSTIRKDSDWLNSLQRNSSLFNRSELKYIADVRRRIIEEAKCLPEPSFTSDRNSQLRHKLSVVKNNFEKVVEILKENIDSKEYFLRTYPAWRTVRDQTILQLKEIAKSVDKNSQDLTAFRGVGSTASIVGGLIFLATGGVALRLLGAAFMGLGSLASAGSSAIEYDLLQQNINKAEAIIEEDRKYSEKLWNWISDMNSIQEALEIWNIDIDNNLKKSANDFQACYKAGTRNDLTMLIQKTLTLFKISPAISNEIANVVGILIATSMLYDRFRPIFNLVSEADKRIQICSAAFKAFSGSIGVVSAVKLRNKKLTTFDKSKIITGMALDAINLIRASKDANETCKEAEKIIEAAGKLAEEARSFEKIYDAVIIS